MIASSAIAKLKYNAFLGASFVNVGGTSSIYLNFLKEVSHSSVQMNLLSFFKILKERLF